MRKEQIERFKVLARKMAPVYADDLIAACDGCEVLGDVDDAAFRKGEYLGGMATMLVNIVENEGGEFAIII